jgi:hypothetical protein
MQTPASLGAFGPGERIIYSGFNASISSTESSSFLITLISGFIEPIS